MKTRAILFLEPGRVGLGEAEIPPPERGELLIRAEFTCVSTGTELRCLAGRQDGTPGWPFIPGYALVGRVADAGPGTSLARGTRVLCHGTSRSDRHRLWGGHVGAAVRAESAVFPLEETLDPVAAVMARPAAIAYHGLRLSRPQPHERVAIVGLGLIGHLSARLHNLTGAFVVGADPSPARVAACRAAGIPAVEVDASAADALRRLFPEGADLVVDATGHAAAMCQSIEAARMTRNQEPSGHPARLLVQGSYAASFPVPYQAAFRRELTLLVPRDQQPEDTHAVLDLLRRGRLDLRDLAGDPLPPESAAEVYAELGTQQSARLTAVFDWRD